MEATVDVQNVQPNKVLVKKKVLVRKVRKVKKQKTPGNESGNKATPSLSSTGSLVSNATTTTMSDDKSMMEVERKAARQLEEAQDRAKALAAQEELQREIERMEKQIQQQKTTSGEPMVQGNPKKRVVRRKVMKKKRRPSATSSQTDDTSSNGSLGQKDSDDRSDKKAKVQSAQAPQRPNLMSAIATAAAKREERLPSSAAQTVSAVSTQPEESTPSSRIFPKTSSIESQEDHQPVDSPVVPRVNLMSAITAAATTRSERLEETDGKLIMQEVEPEVKEQARTTPQLGFDLSEMVSKKAKDREKRLAEGGEKKMTIVKEKEEYKNDFSTICVDAAAMGRLTRLQEHTVEAVSKEKDPLAEWQSGGLMAIQWRSNHMSVIHEAATLGNQTKMPEKVVSNCAEWEEEWDYLDEDGISPRMKQLLELNSQVGEGQHKVDKLVLSRKEENSGGTSMIVRPMVSYSTLDEVKLPKRRPPKIDPKKHMEKVKSRMETEGANYRPLLEISKDVAEKAWERRMRLDRPGGMPKIQENCPCPYCVNPSPYQTHAYREKERKRIENGYESPTSDDEMKMARDARRMARRKKHNPHAAEGAKEGEDLPSKPQPKQERPTSALKPASSRKVQKKIVSPPAVRAPAVPEKATTVRPQRPPSAPSSQTTSPVVDSGCACIIL